MKSSLLKKLAKGVLFLAAFAITAIVLFYSVTSYLGRQEWAATKKALEARGEKLSIMELRPQPIADDLNFFAAPAFAELADGEPFVEPTGKKSFRLRLPEEEQKLTIVKTTMGHLSKTSPGSNSPSATDLGAWAAYYQAEGKVSASNRPAAEVVLEALEPARTVVDEVAKYAKRPSSYFPHRYEDMPAIGINHISPMLSLSKYLRLRAIAEMELGKSDDAARDVLLILRLADSLKGEPIIISLLVRISILNIANRALWEGIARGAWSDAQLAMFEERLRGYDLIPEMADTLRGERGSMLPFLESVMQKDELENLLPGLAFMFGETTSEDFGEWDPKWILIATLYPRGWVYSDLALTATLHQRWIDALGDRTKPLRPADYEKRNVEQMGLPNNIKHFLTYLLMSSLDGCIETCASSQAKIDQARTACALERYRLAHGDLPETLEALVPQFIAAVPLDAITNKPLHYRRISAADFALWSIGWDATDDNATPLDRETKKGDWVWTRQPLS